MIFYVICYIIYLHHTSQHIYYYVYQVLFVPCISTSLMKTSRRLITLILQKCVGQTGPDKHNSKYDMMCSVNLCKVLYDSTESRIKKKKKREKEKKSEGLRKPRCKADWCPKEGLRKPRCKADWCPNPKCISQMH